jgi:hypothetical protein
MALKQRDASGNHDRALVANVQPLSVFNINGRVYPDVTMLGHNVMVVLDDELTPIDGTSASAPNFAAVVSLLNDARARQNKSTMGDSLALMHVPFTSFMLCSLQ